MATKTVRKFTSDQACRSHRLTSRAYQIVEYGHESATSLIEAFRKIKGTRRGSATDEQQDSLRATLVISRACIDSCLKHLFKDCLVELIPRDESVKKESETFVERALRRTDAESGIDCRLLVLQR